MFSINIGFITIFLSNHISSICSYYSLYYCTHILIYLDAKQRADDIGKEAARRK